MSSGRAGGGAKLGHGGACSPYRCGRRGRSPAARVHGRDRGRGHLSLCAHGRGNPCCGPSLAVGGGLPEDGFLLCSRRPRRSIRVALPPKHKANAKAKRVTTAQLADQISTVAAQTPWSVRESPFQGALLQQTQALSLLVNHLVGQQDGLADLASSGSVALNARVRGKERSCKAPWPTARGTSTFLCSRLPSKGFTPPCQCLPASRRCRATSRCVTTSASSAALLARRSWD